MLPPIAPSGLLIAVTAMRVGLTAYAITSEVSTELPPSGAGFPPRPDDFIVLGRTNSPDAPLGTDTVGLLIECYAPTELRAERLANAARAAIAYAAGRRHQGHHVLWWKEGSRPIRFDNPDTDKRVRYQFTGTACVQL